VSGRPGRTQRIPIDETPLNTPHPDIDARIGWLLAMSRLHHHDGSFEDGRRFAQALTEAGAPVSRSLLSRWEAGRIPISYEAMTAYETVLGLEVGQISSVTGYIRASIPSVRSRVIRPKLDPTSNGFADRLDDLIDTAEEGAASARDWQELGWHLAAAPMVHLPRRTWEVLAQRLVDLLPRSVHVTYRQLSTAAMNMAMVPRAQDFLVEAIAAYVSDPAVQVVSTPTGLLDRLPTRRAARLVLDIIDRPQSRRIYVAGVWVAAQKLVRGDFTPTERNELGMLVLREWRRDPVRAGQELAELIGALPEGLRSMLVHAAEKAGRKRLGYLVEHGEDSVAGRAQAYAEERATRARNGVPSQGSYTDDRMLPRLIREAVFHRDSERRHLAALLISSSPFASAMADELLAEMSQGHPDRTRARLATLNRYLAGESHRMRLMAFLDDPADGVAIPAAHSLGHVSLNVMSDHALRNSLGRNWSYREQAKLYALGMSGSPALRVLAESRDAPAWQQAAARWWCTHGPAVTG
jgi:transcriptional regulator with XRE-family HTH domain